MMTKLSLLLVGGALMAPIAHAAPAPTPTDTDDDWGWLRPTIDFRTRYEFRKAGNLRASNALTARARIGLLAGDFHGLSAFGELEATYPFISDYTGAPGTNPNVGSGKTPIPDPETMELNRAWVQYKGFGGATKLGRQRIIRNNAAFIGNVGWRQNEQTYDAISASYEGENFKLFGAYSDRAQRIFGADALGAFEAFEGDFFFLDGTYEANFGAISGYAYLIDVDNQANVGRSNSFGAYFSRGPVYLEAAYQDGSTALGGKGNYDAFYSHVKLSKKCGGATYSVNLEYLQDYFKTPFSTAHAFNGWADAFVPNRLGLSNSGGNYEGLSDIYFGYVRPELPGGLTFKGFLHWFLDDGFGTTYGYEADALFVKKINDYSSALLKLAYFAAEDDGYADIRQASIQYTFKY